MIKLLITGGTIDAFKIEKDGRYIFGDTHIPDMLKQGKCKEVGYEVLMMKDSLLMTKDDRQSILENCLSCNEKRILITHGTDTMCETAQVLGKNVKDKTVVLFGAMIPYNHQDSDALFNIGCAISAVQTLPRGVFVAMNGKIFSWDNVKKNKSLGVFETL